MYLHIVLYIEYQFEKALVEGTSRHGLFCHAPWLQTNMIKAIKLDLFFFKKHWLFLRALSEP